VKRLAALLAVGAVTPLAVPAQQTSSVMAAQQAESLRLAGRPWHAAEALLAAAARELHLDPGFVLAGAKAELHARRYDRARGLLAGQPWLAEYADGEGLAVLAEDSTWSVPGNWEMAGTFTKPQMAKMKESLNMFEGGLNFDHISVTAEEDRVAVQTVVSGKPAGRIGWRNCRTAIS